MTQQYPQDDDDEVPSYVVWGIVGAVSAILIMLSFAVTCWLLACPSPMDVGKEKPWRLYDDKAFHRTTARDQDRRA